MVVIVLRTEAGKEQAVVEALQTRIKGRDEFTGIYAPETITGYIFIECTSIPPDIEDICKVSGAGGLVRKERFKKNSPLGVLDIKEIQHLLDAKKEKIEYRSGDIIEIQKGPLRGTKGKIVSIDKRHSEVSVELQDGSAPIPITLKMSAIKLSQ